MSADRKFVNRTLEQHEQAVHRELRACRLYYNLSKNTIKTQRSRTLRGGSMVKSECCTCRGPGIWFSFWVLHNCL